MPITEAIKETLRGNFVSKEVKEARLKKCHDCAERNGLFCGICDCLLVWKTSLKKEECADTDNKQWEAE